MKAAVPASRGGVVIATLALSFAAFVWLRLGGEAVEVPSAIALGGDDGAATDLGWVAPSTPGKAEGESSYHPRWNEDKSSPAYNVAYDSGQVGLTQPVYLGMTTLDHVFPLPLCLGIIASRDLGAVTLDETLSSFHKAGLFEMVGEVIILFQAIDSEARLNWAHAIASRYPLMTPMYLGDSVGHRAFGMLADRCDRDHVVILEDDFKVEATPFTVKEQLLSGIELLRSGRVDAVRMRRRKTSSDPYNPGETYQRTGKVPSSDLLSHIMWNNEAEKTFPEIQVCRETPKTWCSSSQHGRYTNEPAMYRLAFARNLYAAVPEARGQEDLEPWLMAHWSRQSWTVACSDGVFTRQRSNRTLGIIHEPSWDRSDLLAATQRWVELRKHYHAIVLRKIDHVMSKHNRSWVLRGGSCIGAARYGAWDFLNQHTINIVDFDVDTGVVFSSLKDRDSNCPVIMEELKLFVMGTHPNETMTVVKGCGFHWEVDELNLPMLQGKVSYGPLLNIGVDPLIASSTEDRITNQDGSYAMKKSLVLPPRVWDMGMARLHLPADLNGYTDAMCAK